MLALSQMRSGSQEQLAAGPVGVSDDPFAWEQWCAQLATLRHFDNKPSTPVNYGPLIPWERRLAEMEIPEFQEVNSGTHFENRDYDRPFRHFSVTLRRFD